MLVNLFATNRFLFLWQLHQSSYLILVERLHLLGHCLNPSLSVLALHDLLVGVRVPIRCYQGIRQHLLKAISLPLPDVSFRLVQCNPDVHPRSNLLLLDLLASITHLSSLHLWRHI